MRVRATQDMVLIADEVYQENVWADQSKFVSFKRVVRLLTGACER